MQTRIIVTVAMIFPLFNSTSKAMDAQFLAQATTAIKRKLKDYQPETENETDQHKQQRIMAYLKNNTPQGNKEFKQVLLDRYYRSRKHLDPATPKSHSLESELGADIALETFSSQVMLYAITACRDIRTFIQAYTDLHQAHLLRNKPDKDKYIADLYKLFSEWPMKKLLHAYQEHYITAEVVKASQRENVADALANASNAVRQAQLFYDKSQQQCLSLAKQDFTNESIVFNTLRAELKAREAGKYWQYVNRIHTALYEQLLPYYNASQHMQFGSQRGLDTYATVDAFTPNHDYSADISRAAFFFGAPATYIPPQYQ